MQIEGAGVLLTLDSAVGAVTPGDVLQTDYGRWKVSGVRAAPPQVLKTVLVLGTLYEAAPHG